MKSASGYCFAFPGRDAIVNGLDNSFYQQYKSVRDIFQEASDFLGADIAAMCYEKEEIEQKWQTICLVIHCYAIFKVVLEQYGVPEAFAGYSQGEFTACAVAGVYSFPEVLGLVSSLENILIGEVHENESMYRMVDISDSSLEKICKQVDPTGRKVGISAYISDSQNIISGNNIYVKNVIEESRKNGLRWAIRIQTDKAYHQALCDSAAQKAELYFKKMELLQPSSPIFSCYDGKSSMDAYEINEKLSKQINHPIQWKKIVNQLLEDGVNQLLELGPGCTVSGNTRICNDRLSCRWIGKTEGLLL